MSLDLPPDLQDFVAQELASGRYPSEEEIVRQALLLLMERQRKLDALRADLQPAIERLDRGEGVELDIESVKRRARERLD